MAEKEEARASGKRERVDNYKRRGKENMVPFKKKAELLQGNSELLVDIVIRSEDFAEAAIPTRGKDEEGGWRAMRKSQRTESK